MKAITDRNCSAAQELAYLAQMLLITLWLIKLLVLASVGLGIYLIIVGVVELVA